MKNRIVVAFVIIITVVLLTDLYVYSEIIGYIRLTNSATVKWYIPFIYWIIPFLFFAGFFFISRKLFRNRNPFWYSLLFKLVGLFILIYIPKMIFFILTILNDTIIITFHIEQRIINVFDQERNLLFNADGFDIISRVAFYFSGSIFLIILYGLTVGKFNFKVRRINLQFNKLPDVFNGFMVVHISDLHAGSINGQQKKIMKAIRRINNESPDLILFTGDMVNDFSEELDGWKSVIEQLKAKYGKFSVLGNHDYGEYYPWKDLEEKDENICHIIQKEEQMGFRVLLNENELIKKDGQIIAIIGVENWGLPPFRQYGDLKKALTGLPDHCFKILLSHDPSHWDAEILGKTDIDITLSGHTHGFQFGFRAGRYKWSPIQLKYPRWEGLHRAGDQFLNINTGLGYIGFPGRVGIRPEITLISLNKKE